jgi:TonB family protein
MKSPAGPQPRARRPVQRKQVQLNLRRTPTWPEDENEIDEQRGSFWKWFAVVLLAHVLIVAVLLILFHSRTPKPPLDFISLMPSGDLAKGTAGAQAAQKISPTNPAASHPATETPVPTSPKPVPEKPKIHHVIPPTPTPKPPPIIKDDAREQAPPVKPTPPKPVPPKAVKTEPPKPKIKIDLSQLVDAPDTDDAKPVKTKPKIHPKKTVKTEEKPTHNAADSETDGMTEAQVAHKLGAKLDAEGTDKGTTNGPNGSTHSKANEFADFYQSIHDQVMTKWSVPNSVDETAIDPIVRIHVEKDGRVPADRVTLERSSNNPAFDQSALEAARGMGYTLQPLPDGCPPDISITFNLRQQ